MRLFKDIRPSCDCTAEILDTPPWKHADRAAKYKIRTTKFVLGIKKTAEVDTYWFASQVDIIWPDGPFILPRHDAKLFFIASTTQYGAEANNLWMKFVFSDILMNHVRFLPFLRKSLGNISKEINARVVWVGVLQSAVCTVCCLSHCLVLYSSCCLRQCCEVHARFRRHKSPKMPLF
jgi:hypothetical protein